MTYYRSQLENTADVWFFDQPTIGFCPEHNCAAEYSAHEGLRCPVCRTTELSIFVWDKESKYPE